MRKKVLAAAFAIAAFLPLGFIDNYFEVSKNLDVFATLFKELNSYYVEEIEPNDLMRTGIDAMLSSLDPYTNFISEAEVEDYRFQTTGKYGGIGALIRKRNDYVIIAEPYEGYPAFKAGLMAGDMIIEIDGKDASRKSTDDVSKALKGVPDSEVRILVRRPGNDKDFLVTLVREEIKVKSVPYYGFVTGDIGYIRFTSFRERAAKEVSVALEDMMKRNKELAGVILDLRGNGGGLLNEAVDAANIFIDKGKEIVSTKGKIKEAAKVYRSMESAVTSALPLVVLTDRASASASEIVAGAVQDYDRGLIIGQRTFGKGLVQNTRPLTYNNQIKITIAKYYIPSGRCIQAVDYAHKDEEGAVIRIPDSLKTAFKTANGRTVYDGGGIEPDIPLEPRKGSNLTNSLMEKNIIFDFATKYRAEHREIAPAKDFSLSDQEFKSFTEFVKGLDHNYKSKTEGAVDAIEKTSGEENYSDAIRDDLATIRAKINLEKQGEIIKYRDEIIELIEAEIVSRYYYQSGAIESMFDHDESILKAIEVIRDKEKYRSLLGF